MLKLSHRGLGLLNAQYRSVLRKCLFMNMMGFALLLPTQAQADNATINANDGTSGDIATFIGNLNNGMGNEIGSDKIVGSLYVNTNFTNHIYANNPGVVTAYAWLINYQNVEIGYTKEGTDVVGGVTISNRHNTDAANIYFGGGVIANGGGTVYDSTFKANNTTFSNNTASYFEDMPDPITTGGVISNFSTGSTVMTNNTFTKNYVMSINKAHGGAIYNGTTAEGSGSVIQAIMSTSGNLFDGNYAGNKTEDTTLLGLMGANTVAKEAAGGAIYNTGKYTSTDDKFTNNSAFGETAMGGAVYNGNDNGTGNFTLTNSQPDKINFSNNSAKSDQTTGSVKGGAIYNEGDLTSSNSNFSANTASGGETAAGGAVYNAGNYTSDNENYQNNSVSAADMAALGGAVANSGEFTINGKSKYTNNQVIGSATQTDLDTIGGGAVYNEGELIINGTVDDSGNYNVQFENNQVTSGDGKAISLGGAIYTEDKATLNNIAVISNSVNGESAGGGGFASQLSFTANDSNINNSHFENNTATATIAAMGGAVYNENRDFDNSTNITDTSFIGNKVVNTDNALAAGGAIANGGLIENSFLTHLLIKAQNKEVEFANNLAGETAGTANYGGAIYNSDKGVATLQTSGKDITLHHNIADYGGAVYNAANGQSDVVAAGVLSVTRAASANSLFEANAENGNINFVDNTARKDGGAFFNNTDGSIANFNTADNAAINFSRNQAQNGGAVYNSETGIINITAGDKGSIKLTDNIAAQNGGALYNQGETGIHSTTDTNTADTLFQNNTAQKGGAVYNSKTGSFTSDLAKNMTLTFDNNQATAGQGGAIYNEAEGIVEFTLTDQSKVIFNTTKDDVYNLGNVVITGDTPVDSTDANTTQVILNSTFAGTGTYEISNTQLNIGSTGYIDYEPVMKLTNASVNLAPSSYLNLDTTDTLNDNNFKISRDAVLTYRASAEKPDVSLADNMENNGLLDLGDGVISDVTINTLRSDNGTIHIDVDNPTYTADVIKITDRIYGTSNVYFDNANTLTLENQKIYFAQTQAAQSLDDYKFVSYVNNGLYEIKIGHDNNTTVEDWYFYRTDALNPEVMAYIDLPRAAIEQTRSLLFDVSRIDKGTCNCYRDECNYKVCNFRDNGEKSRLWARPFYRSGSFDSPVETDLTLWGLDAGYDFQRDIDNQFGIFASYRNGTYENDGNGEKYYSNYGSELDINSAIAGAYYRKYFGDLYVSGALYGGMLNVDVDADNNVSASTDGINLGAQVETGYDIRTTQRSVLTPSLRATYDYIKFDDISDDSGKEVTFDTVHDIELELGVKFEYQFNNEHQLPTTGYIKPSIIQTIANGGEVQVNDFTFDETIDNETLGRIEVGADAELVENFSVGAFGNYTFGSEYKAWAVGGNIRYIW